MNDEKLNQPLTKKCLGKFTEEILLPTISSLMDEKLDKRFSAFSLDMDDKLADLKGGLIVLMRKGDRKLWALIGLLAKKKVISEEDAKQILSLEPSPKS